MTHLTVPYSKTLGIREPQHRSHLPLFLWGFVPLQVPPATSDPVAFISFSAKGATVDLTERRSVAIQNVNGAVFVQTDKPLYKPGETGG